MTPELRKTITDWSVIGAFVIAVLTFILDHLGVAGSRIWEIVWPIMAIYAAWRIFQFGRNFYQQVLADRSNVNTRLEALAKAERANYDALGRSLNQGIERQQELEIQMKSIEKTLRQENQELKAKVVELENRLMLKEDQRKAHLEKLAEILNTQQVTRSLADMTPGGLLALGASTPKRKP